MGGRYRFGEKLLGVLAVPFFVSGCSVGSTSPADEAPSEATATEAVASSPAESVEPSATPAEGVPAEESASPAAPRSTAVAEPLPELTPPGTRLKFGESAVLDADGSLADETSRMIAEVTVNSIEEGDTALLDEIDDLGEYAGGTVHYIRATISPLAAFDSGMDRVSWALWGVQDDGVTMATPMLAFEDLSEDCSDTWVLSEPKFGEPHELCRVSIAMPGKKPAGVAFVRDATAVGEQTSDDPYVADPVLWLLD